MTEYEHVVEEGEVEYSNGFPEEALFQTEEGMIEAKLVDEQEGLYKVAEFGRTYTAGTGTRGMTVKLEEAPNSLDSFASSLVEGYDERQVESSSDGIEFSDELEPLETGTSETSQDSETDPTDLKGIDPL